MAIPSLAMIPSGYKDGKVYSVLPSNGDGDFTFSRGSNATRVNKDGLIETITGDTPRLDYSDSSCPSLLLEPQSTNVLPYSEDFSNADWIKQAGSIGDNQAISPDGTLNADKLMDAATAGVLRKEGISLSALDYTFSVFAKKDDRDYLLLVTSFGTGTFDLDNGVVVSSTLSSIGKIEEYTNGWYKCSLTFTATASSPFFRILTGGSQPIIDGTSGTYIWGAQLEQQSYATSYIPTNGATATRLAEVCTDAGTSDTFNDSEGVLMAEISALANDATYRIISLSDGGAANSINIQYSNISNTIRTRIENGGAPKADISITSNVMLFNKISVLYKSNQFELWVNGFKVGEDLIGIPPSGINKLSFDRGDGLYDFYGSAKQIQYYNSALTDSELEELTSWESFLEMAAGQNYTIK